MKNFLDQLAAGSGGPEIGRSVLRPKAASSDCAGAGPSAVGGIREEPTSSWRRPAGCDTRLGVASTARAANAAPQNGDSAVSQGSSSSSNQGHEPLASAVWFWKLHIRSRA